MNKAILLWDTLQAYSGLLVVIPLAQLVLDIYTSSIPPWAYGKEKLGGAEINLPDFSDCARQLCLTNNFRRPPPPTTPPPPSPKKFWSVYHFRGQKKFSGTINWQYCKTFKQIFHDYLYLNNKLRDFGLFIFLLFARLMLDICPTFRLCNLFGGGQLPPLPIRL